MKNIAKNIVLLMSLIFTFCLLIYLTLGNVVNSEVSNILSNIIINAKYIIFSLTIILVISLLYLLFESNEKKFKNKIKEKYLFIIVIVLSGVYLFIQTLVLPFAPSFDANTIYKAIQDAGILTDDAINYFNFYPANKLVMYIFLIFSKLIGNVELSIKILNFILVYGSVILITLLSKKIYTKSNKYITLFFATIFVPYGLLTIPYVYQITIFLTSIVLYLYSLDKKITKALAVFISSLIFILRPTSLIVILVLIFFYGINEFINKEKFYIRIIDIILISVICIIVKLLLGQILYINKVFPYSNLSGASMVWSEYVGTSYSNTNVELTGSWSHTPDEIDSTDNISNNFNKLWNNSGENSLIYEEYKEVKNKTYEEIWQKFSSRVLYSPIETLSYAKNKFNNLFKDTLSLYLYNPVIYNNDLMSQLKNNYQEKYNFIHNSFMYIYTVSAFLYIIHVIRRKENLNKDNLVNLSFIFSVFLISVIYIAILEVSKRYTMDFYIPMLLVSSYIVNILIKKIFIKFEKIKNKNIVFTTILLVLTLISILIIRSFNNSNFIDASYYITNGKISNEQILHIYFEKIAEKDSIVFYNSINGKYKVKEGKINDIPFYNNPKGGVALIMIYNNSRFIQLKQYNNLNDVTE